MAKTKIGVHNGTAYPWMRPVWVRVVIVLVCFAWFGVESTFGESMWSMVAAGITGYAIWTFFITWSDGDKTKAAAEEDAKKESEDD